MTKNNTSFKKGYDPKRYVPLNTGINDFYSKVGALMRQQSIEAVSYVYGVMKDEQAHPKLRYAAAVEILNRGMGKPIDRSVIATIDASGTEVNPIEMTDLELEQFIKEVPRLNQVIEGEIVKP